VNNQRSNIRDRARRGFTLMELLTVMVIMVLMMSIAGVSFFQARQGAELRSAVRAVQTTISLARQQAVVKRTKIRLTCASTYMVLEAVRSSATNTAHATKYLPPLITFVSPATFNFNPDGSAEGAISIGLTQQGGSSTTLVFNPLIGAMVE